MQMDLKTTVPTQAVISWLEMIEVDLEAGDLPAKTRVTLAKHRVKVMIADLKIRK